MLTSTHQWFYSFYVLFIRTAFLEGFLTGSVVKNLPANEGDVGSISALGRSPGEGNGSPLQYFCLKKIPWTEEPGRLQSMGLPKSWT